MSVAFWWYWGFFSFFQLDYITEHSRFTISFPIRHITVLHLPTQMPWLFKNCINNRAMTLYFQIQINCPLPIIPCQHAVFLPTLNIHQVQTTRSVTQLLLSVPAFRGTYGQRSNFHTYSRIWNDIPYYIRTTPSITNFKKAYTFFFVE